MSKLRCAALLGLALFGVGCAGTRPVPANPAAEAAPSCPAVPECVCPTPPVEPAARPAPSDRPTELARVRFAAVGDVLPHGAVKKSAEHWNQRDEKGRSTNNNGWDALFASVAEQVRGADLAFANLETPISPSGDTGSREFNFNATADLVRGLKAAGFDLVSFSNNHVYDQGHRGLVETLAQLDAEGLPQAGAGRTLEEARRGLRLEKNGLRIAVLGASQFFNKAEAAPSDPSKPQALEADTAADLEAAVRAARADSDFVVVSLHWGVEYQPAPREAEIQMAHGLFEAGADVILGTHPHVLQPLEIYRAADGRACLVVYSLGNFISNQSRHYAHGISKEKVGDTRDSALLRFAIVKRDYGAGLVRAELADVSFLPLWTENDQLTRKPKELPDIRVVAIEPAVEQTRAAVEQTVTTLSAGTDAAAGQRLVELRRRLELLERRKQIIEARLGSDFAAE